MADWRVPPDNRLERLHGDREAHYSIRINDQWRICFVWLDGDAYDVEIPDDHSPEDGGGTAGKLKPVHPGKILREGFLKPLGLNPHRLAMALRVPAPSGYEIVREERSISPEMALRIAWDSGTTPDF